MKLYLLVCRRCYLRYFGQDVGAIPFAEVMNYYKELHLPHFESVRRSRARLQAKYPEIAPSLNVKRWRKMREDIYQNYANT